MNLDILSQLRLLIPGILIYITVVLFLSQQVSVEIIITKLWDPFKDYHLLVIAAIYVAGTIYRISNIRCLLWSPLLKSINSNIKSKLFSAYPSDIRDDEKVKLLQGRSMMNIFYHFVDNDSSLSEKAKLVRFNGVLCTSTIDGAIILSIGAFIAFAYWLGTNDQVFYRDLGLILIGMAIFCASLIYPVIKRHINLSNDQLEFITQNYKEKLIKKIQSKVGQDL